MFRSSRSDGFPNREYVSQRRTRSTKRQQSSSSVLPQVVLLVIVAAVSFYAGCLWTLQASMSQWEEKCSQHNTMLGVNAPKDAARQLDATAAAPTPPPIDPKSTRRQPFQFPKSLKSYLNGMARITKQDFTDSFDLGVPLDNNVEDDILLLYQKTNALPEQVKRLYKKKHPTNPTLEGAFEELIPHISQPSEALVNCETLHVILTDHSSRKQCVALVPQYESYHVMKYMRTAFDPRTGKTSGKPGPSHPLTLVSRGYQSNGVQQFLPPLQKHTDRLWDMLGNYIKELPNVLAKLKPLAQSAATDDKTVIVMVCNFGQSELLMNFACSARASGFDLQKVLVFATDVETQQIAQGLGIKVFYDETNFGDMPSEAAGRYGDRKFTAMMMAKVFCVQLVSLLGYDVLFQDVDIVWFRNPLEYFHNQALANATTYFDMYFQDDGAHSTRYVPYSANSGFYYVRHNDRTQHFFNALLMAGDLVLKTDSHQQALIALLSEHASLFGLRVKVLDKNMEEFPGGYHYHQKTGKYMRAFFADQVHPYLFHMSWTKNKDNKLLFLKQSGMWYVQDECVAKKPSEISSHDMATACCAAEALVSCHYRDKPSKIPCKDKPPIDEGHPSFW